MGHEALARVQMMHVEVPIEAPREDGTRLRGRIDFLVDTPQGWVLVDHKSNPRGAANYDQLAGEHGPQLASYADALRRATGRHVHEQWLFLPVAARAIRIRADPLSRLTYVERQLALQCHTY